MRDSTTPALPARDTGHQTCPRPSGRPLAILDFEASCLVNRGMRSFPIEVAVGFPESGEVRSWLIRPEPEWLEAWTWDPEAERLHGLSRDYLLANGRPRSEVAQELAAALNGHEPLSDNPAYEQYWLWGLFGQYPGFRIGSLGELFQQIAGGGLAGQAMLELASAHAREKAPLRHRATADVKHYLVMLRELRRLAGEDRMDSNPSG